MNPLCTFLALLYACDGDFYLASTDLALEHIRRQVGEIVLTDALQWYDCLAVVLGHQDE
ncbi:hypothetical protein D3C75_1303390 [compost metagenome]